MNATRRGPLLALAQGLYFALTGLWPFASMDTFLRVTGPKTDLWLVHTVGVLVLVVGVVLMIAGARRRVPLELRLLGGGAAFALALVDLVYAGRGRIGPIYLADAVVELALALLWVVVSLRPAPAVPAARPRRRERPARSVSPATHGPAPRPA
jgi:hypothetical protein